MHQHRALRDRTKLTDTHMNSRPPHTYISHECRSHIYALYILVDTRFTFFSTLCLCKKSHSAVVQPCRLTDIVVAQPLLLQVGHNCNRNDPFPKDEPHSAEWPRLIERR